MQSAVGGMAVSVIGMLLPAAGYLPPVAGALTQELIDVGAVVNATIVGHVLKEKRELLPPRRRLKARK